jgi:hypothetical protein
MSTMPTHIVHQTIERPWTEVYDFASEPTNMPSWAAGLASGLERDGEEWIASGPLGDVHVRFAERNSFGVIDHVVTLPDGLKVYNALRVTPNGSGAEVSFTVLRLPNMSDEDFQSDVKAVHADLLSLKKRLESR